MQGYYQKHAAEFNNQYFNRRHPLQTLNICIKISKNRMMPQALINTQALVILIINLFLIFSRFEQKKLGILFGLCSRPRVSYCLPAGQIRTLLLLLNQKKAMLALDTCALFFYSHMPIPWFLSKKQPISSMPI
jgi:hypothetical protein